MNVPHLLVRAAVLTYAALVMTGCSDDSSGADIGAASDAAVDVSGQGDLLLPDTTAPPDTNATLPRGNMGEGCTGASDCKKGSDLCVIYDSDNNRGICSRKCTPDDSTTPLIDEDNCPDDFFCAAFKFSNKTVHYCLKKCDPSLKKNDCPKSSKQACHPLSTRFSSLDQAVCWYAACTTAKDCPVLGSKTCSTDKDCSSLGTGAFCYTDTTPSRCALPGKCSAGGICAPHTHGKSTAKVGDPCTSDLDCPNNGRCLPEDNSGSSGIGVSYRNGYCSVPYCSFSKQLPEYACPSGSTCHNLFFGGLCHKTCDLAKKGTCRGNAQDRGGDYECYDWSQLTIGNTKVSAKPVCQNAPTQECDSFGSSATLSCASLSPQGNKTNMSCRDRYTGAKKSNPKDPKGICLDDTASGPFGTAPADSGVVPADSGVPLDGALPPPPDGGPPPPPPPDGAAPFSD